MKLQELFPHIRLDTHSKEISVQGISRDSRDTGKGDVFFIIEGDTFDVYHILPEIEHKVCAFVGDIRRKEHIASLVRNKPVLYLDNVTQECKRSADLFYGKPPSQYTFIGLTGTNGKTTTAYLIHMLLKKVGLPASLLGTLSYSLNDENIPAPYTTPDYLCLRKLFSQIQSNSCHYVIMEVSSHGIDQSRVEGIPFSRCIFTNLSRDHLDYHKSMEHYYNTKKRLFINNPQACAFMNIDDLYGVRLFDELSTVKVPYSINSRAVWRAQKVHLTPGGTEFQLCYHGKKWKVKTSLLGFYNIYNLLAAISVVFSLRDSLDDILHFVPYLEAPRGRLEQVAKDIFVDYAHTPDALANTLRTLKDVGYKKILCVFGCGGERDKGKRKLMGACASGLASFSFITSDNPRSEDPLQICGQIKEGFTHDNFTQMIERRDAIHAALKMKGNDETCAVLIAGKGHERYQITGGRKIPFSDQKVIRELLKRK